MLPTHNLPKGVQLFDHDIFGDKRGDLVSVEQNRTIPFEIARVYTIFHTSYHMARGCHAHIGMQQALVNITGSLTLIVDDGTVKSEINLDRPGRTVIINGLVWRELTNFSPGSVINCFSDKFYDESEYIRDYNTFRSLCATSK